MSIPKLIPEIGMKKCFLGCHLGILLLLFSCCVTAKPLYVIGDRVFATEFNVMTFNSLLNGSIEYVTEDTITARCEGPADLAFTTDGQYMFTVSAGSAWIQVVDTATMTIVEEEHVSGTQEDFSGVAFDSVRNLVYSVDKGQNQLYVYDWDSVNVDLTLAENGQITLPGTSTYDIALDLINKLLFVSNGTNQIHIFNTVNWSLNRIITLGRNVERIGLDERMQVLYAGHQVSGHPHLLQYDLLSTMEETLKIGDDASVVGIAVDDSTSLVYVATLHPFYINSANRIDVFDAELNALDQAQVDGHLACLGLPAEGVSYSPLALSKHIVSGTDLIGGVHYATAGNIITYEIDLAAATPSENPLVQKGAIVDTLPFELDYVSSSSVNGMMGLYDPILHTVTWLYPSQLLSEPLTVVLEARVKSDSGPGLITNEAVVLSGGAGQITTQVDVLVGESNSPIVRADLKVYASAKIGGSFSDELMGVLILPLQIDLNHVARDVPLVLDPGGTEASFQIVYGRDGKVIIDAYFDKTNLLASIKGQSMETVTLRITGRLWDGDLFFGETTIPLTGNVLLQE
jgi:DNA-binding beta-propeller fold protein YncE